MDVLDTLSGSVPVATMAVSSEALWAVEVGSWLIGVVGLGLMVWLAAVPSEETSPLAEGVRASDC